MITSSQADQIAERVANRLEAVMDQACPMPVVECRTCRGKGFWLRDGDLVFCPSCDAGRVRRQRQGVMNRMVHGSYMRAVRNGNADA